MHQGDLLDMRARDLEALSDSIFKTAADFKNPPITPEIMLRTISSRNQFWNPELAQKLAHEWGVEPESTPAKAKGREGPQR